MIQPYTYEPRVLRSPFGAEPLAFPRGYLPFRAQGLDRLKAAQAAYPYQPPEPEPWSRARTLAFIVAFCGSAWTFAFSFLVDENQRTSLWIGGLIGSLAAVLIAVVRR